jgi:putative endonuclease
MSRPGPGTGATAPATKKRGAWRFGHWAEVACAWFLRLKGYRILARGFRAPVGEIDIVARRGTILAVVEVKGRHDLHTAAEALGRRQQSRIARAAEAFLRAHPACGGLNVRSDVMLVRRWRLPAHVTDAWRPDA